MSIYASTNNYITAGNSNAASNTIHFTFQSQPPPSKLAVVKCIDCVNCKDIRMVERVLGSPSSGYVPIGDCALERVWSTALVEQERTCAGFEARKEGEKLGTL